MRKISKSLLTILLGGSLVIALTAPLTASDPEHGVKPADTDMSHDENIKDEHAEMDKHAKMDEPAAKDEHAEMDEPAAKVEHAEMDEPVAKDEHAKMDEPAAKDEHAKMDEPAAKDEHAEMDEPAAKDEHAEVDEHAAKDEHGETDEHGEEVHREQFETSLDPLPEGPNQPWRLIRHLQLLQDKIVVGEPGALANYRDALVDMSHKLLADDRISTWSHERNVMAAATYLLIGGDPNVGQHAFDLSDLSLVQKMPLAAAIAYVERKYARAGRLLMALDIERLPGSAKGQFALVKAMATSSLKTEEATIYLDQARRFAPGTLTEEAALRRLIRIAGEKAEKSEGAEVFLNHANSYFRHYSNSLYVTDFLRNYGFGIVRTAEEMDERALAHLKSVFPKLKKQHQIFLIAIVARNAVVLGRVKLGRWASDWLLQNVDANDKLHARIELYQIATSILDADSYADAAKRLENLPVDFLGKSDMSLHMALTQLSSRIGSEPIDVEKLKELTRIEKQSFPGDEPELPFDVEKEMELAKTNPILVKTEELFAKADKLLGK